MSRTRLKKAQRCCSNTADGSRCAKFCAPGETVCGKHKPDAQPKGIIARQDTDDPAVILRRLMRDRDPTVRLRAVNAYLDMQARAESKGCQDCARRAASGSDNENIVQYASTSQRAELRTLIEAVNNVKAIVRRYIAEGGQPTQEPDHATVIEHLQPPRPRAAVSSEPDAAGPAPDPDPEQVSVWRDGQLVEEPRADRDWEAI